MVPSALSALLVICYYLLTPWHSAWSMVTAQVYAGAWWQPLTANLMHHDQAHLWFNVAGIWIAWLLFPAQLQRNQDWWVLLPVAIVSSLSQLWFAPGHEIYAGFSGALYGLFAYAALQDALAKQWIGAAIVLGILIKSLLDFSFPSLVEGIALYAHSGGIVSGFVLALVVFRCSQAKNSVQSAP